MPLLIDEVQTIPPLYWRVPAQKSQISSPHTWDVLNRALLHFTRPPINNDEVEYDNKFKGESHCDRSLVLFYTRRLDPPSYTLHRRAAI